MATKSKPTLFGPSSASVEPPSPWNVKSKAGWFMGYSSSPDGRLLLLSDLVVWLEESGPCPRQAAIKTLCDKLHPEMLEALYMVHKEDFASRLPSDHQFGYMTSAQLKEAHAQLLADRQKREVQAARAASWAAVGARGMSKAANPDQAVSWPTDPAVEPGIPSLLNRIRETWSAAPSTGLVNEDHLTDPQEPHLARLAITLGQAYALWNYGKLIKLADAAVQKISEGALRNRVDGEKWTEEHDDLLMSDFEAQTGTDTDRYERLTKLWPNLSESNLKMQIKNKMPVRRKKRSEEKVKANSPWAVLGPKTKANS
jgi:hypothetical protein